ncbi:MAG TPA: hypothetical protein VFL57_08390, partial [Bryobacteraceae bacterium]|nr:hypothetical protein [Bryobacteraceae bacterium]
ESNTAVNRPLPLWPYTSSDNVNRARNSEPGKMSVNLCMQFVDYAWRFATVPAQEIALRLWQNVAHGGAAAFSVNGTLEQQDMQAVEAARAVFRWLAEHERFYVGQANAAKVLLLGGAQRTGRSFSQSSYRGMFRLLSEEHIPFAVTDNMDWLGTRDFDLVIATDWAPAELTKYSGPVLIVSPRPPEFPVARVIRTWNDVQGYMRVRDPSAFPSLAQTKLLMLNGDYTETEGPGLALTLVPPSMIGPPEKIHIDQQDTTRPGIVRKGRVTWIPWDTAGLYYKHSLPAHAGLLRDVIDRMLPRGRQLRTNAHPLVEMTVMRQGERTLLHLINLSGHTQTAYFAPVPVRDIRVALAGSWKRAQAQRSVRDLPLRNGNEIVVPEVRDYELVVLE